MSVFLITDQHDHQLRVVKLFDESGVTPVAPAGVLASPTGLAVDGEGNVFVTDGSNDCLAIWDLWTGTWKTFGGSGAGQGQFLQPAAVAVDLDNRIYIADTGNSRIVRVDDPAGAAWTTLGAPGGPTPADPIAQGLFRTPLGIAVDDLGRVIVTDPGAGRVVRFDEIDGSGWTALAIPGGAGQTRPLGISAAGEWIAISDVGNGAVHLFDLDDHLLASLDGTNAGLPVPAYVATDGECLAVADIVANELRRYRLAGDALVLDGIVRGSSPARIAPLFQQIGGIASGGH